MSTSARSNRILRTGAVIALALGGLVSQAARADNLNPVVGAGIGALAGAAIGQSMGGRDGAMVGAAIGGVAGVGIATQGGGQRHGNGYGGGYYQQPQAVVYPAPRVVYQAPPVYAAPVYVPAPSYGYRVVERVNYYPAPVYGYRGGPGPRWERHDHDWDHHDHGHHRGWDRD
jgi:hypothetical protein